MGRALLNALCCWAPLGAALDVVRKDLDLDVAVVQPGGVRLVVTDSSAPDLAAHVEDGRPEHAAPCIDPQSREFVLPHAGGSQIDRATEDLIAGATAIGAGVGRMGAHLVAHIVAGPLGNLLVSGGVAASSSWTHSQLRLEVRDRDANLAAFEMLVRESRRLVRNDRLEADAQQLVAKATDVGRTVQQILMTATPEQRTQELAGVHNTLELSRSDWIVGDAGDEAAERSFMQLLPAAAMAEAHVAVLTVLALLEAEEAQQAGGAAAPGRWAALVVDAAGRYGADLLAMQDRAVAWRVAQYAEQDQVEWEQCNGQKLDPDVFEVEPATMMTRLYEYVVGLHDERLAAHLCPARRCWLEDGYLCPEADRDVLASVRTYERFMFTQLRETFLVPPHVKVPSCAGSEAAQAAFEARRAEIRATLHTGLLRSLDRTLAGVLVPVLRARCPELGPDAVHADTHEAALRACFAAVYA